jgi:hypothetical protein
MLIFAENSLEDMAPFASLMLAPIEVPHLNNCLDNICCPVEFGIVEQLQSQNYMLCYKLYSPPFLY